jgi:hypothetical protein
LRHFVVGSVQLFELFRAAGPHPRLIERTIIRERMLIASARPEEEHQPEKRELVAHDSIVSAPEGISWKVCFQDTRPKGQDAKKPGIAKVLLNLVPANWRRKKGI